MKIGELSKKTGCKVVTIRYYEKEGLLRDPGRTFSNYRLYDENDLNRLNFIIHCRLHDIGMSEIKSLLKYWEDESESCGWIGDMLDKHINDIDKKIKSLKELKNNLKDLRGKCSGDDVISNCEIVKSLNKHINCNHNV